MFEIAGNDISTSLRGTKQSVPNMRLIRHGVDYTKRGKSNSNIDK